jgi:hypothetical protein
MLLHNDLVTAISVQVYKLWHVSKIFCPEAYKYDWNILDTIKRRKANWIGHLV